jgi:hypothetical protein
MQRFQRLVAILDRLVDDLFTTGAPEHTVRHVPPQAAL